MHESYDSFDDPLLEQQSVEQRAELVNTLLKPPGVVLDGET